MVQVAVVGGGAAGLMAGIAAAAHGTAVVLEGGPRVGRKLLLTGSGRCNLTNLGPWEGHYHGTLDPGPVLEALPPRAAVDLFASFGLLTRADGEGRAYPWCSQASAVLDTLRLEARRRGVEERVEFPVAKVRPKEGGFLLSGPAGSLEARRVVLAFGGRAAPATGSDGRGFSLLKRLGHRLVPQTPGLTWVETDPGRTRSFQGLRVLGRASLIREGKILLSREGEIQFRDRGLSGICLFDLARLAPGGGEVSLDLLPQFSPEALPALLRERERTLGRPWEELLTGLVNKRVGQALLREVSQAEELAGVLKDWRFPVKGLGPWEEAQVTVGGAHGEDFDSRTLESRLVPGLYCAGEALDLDGDCGGFNLQWAWASGFAAGTHAGREAAR